MQHMSIFLSLILRHKPEEIGIKLDSHGWASISDIVAVMSDIGKNINIK